MTDEQLNKRLHEIMGIKWYSEYLEDTGYNYDLVHSWRGFGILWEFIQEHPRRGEMLKKWEREDDSGTMYIEEWIIDPSSLAEIVVEFFEADI